MKGAYNEECNRTACQKPPAIYYNHSTRMYYCTTCAHLINDHNPEFFAKAGHDLCTLEKPKEDENNRV